LQFRFRKSAFKHGVTEADIRHAFENYRTVKQFQNRENVYLLISFYLKANPIEILYNEFGDNSVNVFHAMVCKNRFLGMDEYITNPENPVNLGPNLMDLGIKPGFAHNYLPYYKRIGS
jgi:hypothetical protein